MLIDFKMEWFILFWSVLLGNKKSPFKKVKGQNIWSHTMSC